MTQNLLCKYHDPEKNEHEAYYPGVDAELEIGKELQAAQAPNQNTPRHCKSIQIKPDSNGTRVFNYRSSGNHFRLKRRTGSTSGNENANVHQPPRLAGGGGYRGG